MSSALEVAGLLTHALVLALGVGGLAGVIPLARGRRGGLGLVLMALAMGIVVLEPTWRLGPLSAALYTLAFLSGLWLLLGPEKRR